MDLDMTIDRLVLDVPDLDPLQRAVLVNSLKEELALLLAGPAAWTPSASAAVQGPDIAVPVGAAGLGRELARAIYEGIRP